MSPNLTHITGEHTYREFTHDIEVTALPFFMPERSDPQNHIWFYGYTITIHNHGLVPVELDERQWAIRDGKGKEETVRGRGVVGQNPTIAPGEQYQYSSFCPLNTPTGNMRGLYTFRLPNKQVVEVKIPLFFLRPPQHFVH